MVNKEDILNIQGDLITNNDPSNCKCTICGLELPSKTKLFKHLSLHGVDTMNTKPFKVVLLVGWLSPNYFLLNNDNAESPILLPPADNDWLGEEVWLNDQLPSARKPDVTSRFVDLALFQAIQAYESGLSSSTAKVTYPPTGSTFIEKPRGYSRASSTAQRSSPLYSSEPTCHGLLDTIVMNIKPWGVDPQPEYSLGKDGRTPSLIIPYNLSAGEAWRNKINEYLPPNIRIHKAYPLSVPYPIPSPSLSEIDDIKKLPTKTPTDLQAEVACTQRRYEYIFPLRLLINLGKGPFVSEEENLDFSIKKEKSHRDNLPKHLENSSMNINFDEESIEGKEKIKFFRRLKKAFKYLSGERKFRIHNLVAGGGAAPDDPCVYRRIDRLYHCEIIQLPINLHDHNSPKEDWVVFSVSGDTLLKGEARKLLGISLALANGWINYDFVNDALGINKLNIEESNPSEENQVKKKKKLNKKENNSDNITQVTKSFDTTNDWVLSVPSLPGWGLYLAECRYSYYESKNNLKLDPRRSDKGYPITYGIQDEDTSPIDSWIHQIHNHIVKIARKELKLSVKDNMILGGDDWISNFKESCNKSISEYEELKKYRLRKTIDLENEFISLYGKDSLVEILERKKNISDIKFSSDFKDTILVPKLYHDVLKLLREADYSQLWPASSTRRQNVITSETLLEKGGRGGSFSIGALPSHLSQPKANQLFPDLLLACFRLEKALNPLREPSSTIAVNRHAQFTPHRDTGIGSGQTKSLIVALGNFTGGELVSKNKVYNIKYNPIEFDGWQELHYTLPFVGERYSLVWFTPLGVNKEDLFWLDKL